MRRRPQVNDKKRKWFLLLLVSCFFLLYSAEIETDIVNAERSNAKIGFYESKKGTPESKHNLPNTGENRQENELQISGISILFIVTGMISYRTLMNKERI